MSMQKMEDIKKVDVSFYNGYTDYRGQFRRYIFIHIFQALMLTIFIPIDSKLLGIGNRMALSLGIALADSLFSLFIMVCIYHRLFVSGGVRKFLYLAIQTNHLTNELSQSSRTIQDCTSRTMLYQIDGITIEDLDEKTIKIYSNISKHEIALTLENMHNGIASVINIYKFVSLLTMILIISFMISSKNMNPGEIAVLTIFLLLQVYLKLTLFFLLILVTLSPIICICAMIYCCFCMPKQQAEGSRRLHLASRSASTHDVVKSSGQCAVCLMDINVGENIYQLSCSQKHIFHKGCLQKWAKVSFTCPHCRAVLPTINVQQKGQQQQQAAAEMH